MILVILETMRCRLQGEIDTGERQSTKCLESLIIYQIEENREKLTMRTQGMKKGSLDDMKALTKTMVKSKNVKTVAKL